MDAVNECRHINKYDPPIIKSAYSDNLRVRTLEKDKYGTFVVKNYEKYYDIPKSFRESHNLYCLEKNIKN